MAWMALRVCSYELYEADGLLPGDAGDGGDDMANDAKAWAQATKAQGKSGARVELRGEGALREKDRQRRRQDRPGGSRQARRQQEQRQQGTGWKQRTKEARRAHLFGKRQKGGGRIRQPRKPSNLVGWLACNGSEGILTGYSWSCDSYFPADHSPQALSRQPV
jgi:hypothetical protein